MVTYYTCMGHRSIYAYVYNASRHMHVIHCEQLGRPTPDARPSAILTNRDKEEEGRRWRRRWEEEVGGGGVAHHMTTCRQQRFM